MATARKQKARGFGKFLNFIGLVDDQESDFAEFEDNRSRGRSTGRSAALEDEFEEEPRMNRSSSRSTTSASRRTTANNRYDEEDWASVRPDYETRTTQRRYGDSQRYGGNSTSQQKKSSSRYADTSSRSTSDYYYSSERERVSGASARPNAAYYTPYSSYDDITMGNRAQSPSRQRYQTIIFKLRSVDECKDVILALIEKTSVLLNLDGLDSVQAQRALDTMSGAAFALGATLSKATDRAWLIAPSNVEVAHSSDDDYDGRYI